LLLPRSLLQFAASQLGRPVDRGSLVRFSLPVEPWVYPLWAVAAAMLTLVIARRSVGLRWTATTVAVAYIGWRCVLWPILAGVGFPTSAIPLLILAGALAIDLICLLDLPWPAEASLGTAITTVAVYLAGFVQSYALVTPPISYWSAPIAALILFAGWSALAGLRARRNLTLF
jgi:hypothetical protein